MLNHLPHILLSGAGSIMLPFTLVACAIKYIPCSIVCLLFPLIPIMNNLYDKFGPLKENLSKRKYNAMILSLASILIPIGLYIFLAYQHKTAQYVLIPIIIALLATFTFTFSTRTYHSFISDSDQLFVPLAQTVVSSLAGLLFSVFIDKFSNIGYYFSTLFKYPISMFYAAALGVISIGATAHIYLILTSEIGHGPSSIAFYAAEEISITLGFVIGELVPIGNTFSFFVFISSLLVLFSFALEFTAPTLPSRRTERNNGPVSIPYSNDLFYLDAIPPIIEDGEDSA